MITFQVSTASLVPKQLSDAPEFTGLTKLLSRRCWAEL